MVLCFPLHVPESDLLTTFSTLSFKYGDSQREEGGRLFTDVNEVKLATLVSTLPHIKVKRTWITEDNRPERNQNWLNTVLKKNNSRKLKIRC
ncbi:hypothetical protein H4J46_05470 [Colwellia sp. MB02u-6]|uniref:hypothetical protein n=1 Tax=Colwellia sp. MB02u-6 TaxID=2759824 RepID=UPI0015F67AD0|nr:hypothetical protein [Colwellia sp. MB02u-6]MBA6327392.1 hypothetical protein [Colwellia sp. MB02u-6]